MAAYTFDEVLSAFQNAQTNNPQRWGGMDVYEFARQASQIDPNFQPVAQSNWIQRTSRDIDVELEKTGLPTAAGNIIGQLASAFGPEIETQARQAGRTLPRQVVNLLPLAAGGPIGLAGAFGLTGADIYTQTGSPLAGVVGGAAGMLAPLAGMRVGGQAALGQLAKGGARVGVSEAGELVPQGIAQRIAEFTGRQAGAYVGGEVAGEATSVAAGGGLYDPTSPEAIVSNLVGTIPFTGLDIVQYAKEVRPAIARYSTDKQMDVEQPAKEVPEFTPKGTFANDEIAQQLITQQARYAEIQKLEKTPELEAEKSQILKNITQLAFQRTPIPSADVTTGVIAPDTQLDLFDPENIARIQQANAERNKNDATSILSSVKTANNELRDLTEEQLSLNFEARAKAGATPIQAVSKSVQEVSNRAVEKVEVKSALKGSAKRVVENRARRQEEFNTTLATQAPELQKTIASSLLRVQQRVTTDPAKADMRFQGTVLKWLQEGSGDVNKLDRSLNSAFNLVKKTIEEPGKETLVEGREQPVVTQADFDQDNFVQDVLGAAHASDEGDAPNGLLASAIVTKIGDSVRAMEDLSDGEIQALGLTDMDVPTWRKAFEHLHPMLKKGKINTAELQKTFDEAGVELDAMEFLMEPATVEMFAHAAKKLYGEDVQVARGDDGNVHLIGPSGDVMVPGKIPSLMIQTRNLLDLWFAKAGWKPDENRTLTKFGMRIAGLAARLDDVNLGVLKSELDSLGGLSDVGGAQVWLKNMGNDPVRLHAVLAHELGHQIDSAHFQQQVPMEWQQRYDNASRFLRDLTPGDRGTVMEILKESLPKQFRDDMIIDAMIAKASGTPNEAVAQATSMVMLGAVGKNRFWRSAVEMLPKPLADWVFHVLDVAKATLDAVSASAWFSLSDFSRSKEFRTSLTEYRRTLDKMWRTQKDLDNEVARLMSLEQLTPEGLDHTANVLANPLEVNTLHDANLVPSAVTGGSWMFNRFSPQVEDWYVDKKYLAKGVMKNFLQKFAPVRNLKEWYSDAKIPFGIPLVQQRRREQVAEQVFTPFNLKWSERGSSAVDDKGEVLTKVMNSPHLQKVVSDIRRDMNLLGAKYDEKKLNAKLDTLSTNDRATVYSYVKSMTMSEEVMRQVKHDSRVENVKKVAATFILKKNPGVGAEQALHAARQIWDAIESGDPTLMSAASTVVGSSAFLDSFRFYQNLKTALTTFKGIEAANPFYTTERRLGRYFINYVRKDGTTDTIAFDDAGAWQRAQDRLNRDLNVEKLEAVDSDELNTRHSIKQELIDAADKYDQQVADNIRGLLSEDDFDTIRPYLSVKNELLKEFAAASPALMAGLPGDVTTQLKREFKGERKGLNLVRNQLINLNARVSELARSDARSDLMLNMSDPKQTYNRDPHVVSLIHQNYENYQMPDTQLGQLTNLGAFTYFLGGNMSNMLMEGAQWMVTLPSILTEIGAANHGGKGIGIVESWSRTLSAAKDVAGWYQKGKKWKDPEVADLMEQASYEIDRTTGTMEEVISKESMALINSARMGKGLAPISLGNAVGNPLTHYMTWMRKMYQVPSGLNNRIALVAGYKLARERGLGHQAAIEDAKRVSYLANFNEGKAGRPIAPFSNKGAIGRTAAQMMFSLQAYNLGIVSTFARQAMTAFSKRTDLTLAQRRQARRALLQLGASQFAIAGTLGMPFVGAGLAVLNQLIPDLNAEEDVRKTIALLGGHDRELGGLISRFASDGLLNQVLPIDIASRYGVGNIAGLSSYDGWKMENFFGPVGGMLAAGFKGASNSVQGNMGQAFEDVVPIGFKNLTKVYRDDWKIMDSEGRLLLEPNQAELVGRAIGFSPTRVAASQRAGRLEARSKSIEGRQRKRFRTEVADLFADGQVGKAQQILQQKALSDPTFDKNYEIRQITEILLRRQFPRSGEISGDTRRNLLGVPPEPQAQQLQRHQLGSQTQVALGGRPRREYQAPDLQYQPSGDESLSFLEMFR